MSDLQHPNKSKSLYQRARAYLSRHRVDVWRLVSGSGGEDAAAVVFSGREINKEYLKIAFFDGDCREEHLGRKWKFQARRAMNSRPSLFVSEYGANDAVIAKELDDAMDRAVFTIPFWLGWSVDISEDAKKIVKSNSSLESDVRRIRKNKLSYAVIEDPQAFEAFYDTMYLPYIRKNYKNMALLMSRSEMLSERDKCQLLVVQKNGDPIGGILIKYDPEYPRLWSIGVQQASDEFIRDGVVGALYYFPVMHLQQMGHKRVHFGATRPFLNDGVLNYKKKWPIENAGFTKSGFHVRIVSQTQATIDLLKQRPFVYAAKGKLYGAVFIGSSESIDADDFKKMYKSFHFQGLERIVIFVLGQTAGNLSQPIPLEFQNFFDIRGAGNLSAEV